VTTNRARIAAPPNQFTTMRLRSTTRAIDTARDDEIDFDMIDYFLMSNSQKRAC
jgi:hypothetical protein